MKTASKPDFTNYLESRIEMVDSALDGLLPPGSARPAKMHSAMRYGVFPGGKRFRAVLLTASYETFGGDPEDALPFACAVELVHSYSLAHDDLPAMDNDDYRRGKPSLHKKYGEAMGILAGDALLTAAFQIISDPRKSRFSPVRTLRAVNELAAASGAGGMLGGQAADMQRNGGFTEEELEYIHLRKTAELIKCSVRIGAILAGAGKKQLGKLSDYGENLGLAFQMLDDINDAEAGDCEPNFAGTFTRAAAAKKAGGYARGARESLAESGKDAPLLEGIIDYMTASLGNG